MQVPSRTSSWSHLLGCSSGQAGHRRHQRCHHPLLRCPHVPGAHSLHLTAPLRQQLLLLSPPLLLLLLLLSLPLPLLLLCPPLLVLLLVLLLLLLPWGLWLCSSGLTARDMATASSCRWLQGLCFSLGRDAASRA
ncbi:MAG: hypothetical protein ACT6T3_22015 [Agrobacterium sp.]|uniref:hypothetical protein n=1 Tax=Agrobacterium sp. TaxID=361 RepID=UPI004034B46C